MSERNSRLMSIGEVAKSLHITRRMILNYEDKGILLPDVKTGSGGNRYYTPETLTRIRAIRRLQTLGISLDADQALFRGCRRPAGYHRPAGDTTGRAEPVH